jgi:stage II sporulation protein D
LITFTILIFSPLISLQASLAPATLSINHQRVPEQLTEPTIRVRVAKALEEVMLSGTDLKRLLHPTQDLKSFDGRKSIRLNCRGFAQSNQAHPALNSPLLLASVVSKTGLVTLADERFQGELKVVSSDHTQQSCDVIHVTTMEDYISTLLAKEMNAEWSIEALKAQAIAARTYAYHKIMSNKASELRGVIQLYDLESSERHQVSGSFFDTTTRTLEATRATRGLILKTLSGELTETFFHAKCGGHTLEPHQVWTNRIASYQAVADPYCKNRGNLNTWKTEINKDRFISFLQWAQRRDHLPSQLVIQPSTQILLVRDQLKTPELKVFIGGQTYQLNKSLLRRFFGRVDFESNLFMTTWTGEKLLVSGEGKGHGVGMCQIGALGMADSGKNYRQILTHYYPGHQLEKIY